VIGILRAKGGQVDKRVASTEIDQLRAQVSALTEQVEQLRNTSTGFDLSFDKRLSEIELNARLAKLNDAPIRNADIAIQSEGRR
jgi:ribosome-interacting GTPase 1